MHQVLPRSGPDPRPVVAPPTAKRRRTRGQSLVEFALALPVVLVIVLAAIDLGRVYLGWVVLNNAARVGANYAALNPTAWDAPGNAVQQAEYDAQVRQARSETAISLGGCDGAAVPAPQFPTGKDMGDLAELTLVCQFSPITPVIGDIVGTVSVTARAKFPIREGTVDLPPGAPPSVCPALAEFFWQVDPVDTLRVQFFDDSIPTGAASRFRWDFGDGNSSTARDPVHTYTQAGTYTVTQTVEGCSDMAHDVTVTDPPPTPGPGATPTPTPSATTAPTPTPTPGCTIPSFIEGTRKNDAQQEWDQAGFMTTVQFLPGPGNYRIEYQSLVGGQGAPCNVTITVGPDPQP